MRGKSVKASRQPLLGSPADELDPYLPDNGNLGYRISRYDLELEYKVASNRLEGTATLTATSYVALQRFTLDLAQTLSVSRAPSTTGGCATRTATRNSRSHRSRRFRRAAR